MKRSRLTLDDITDWHSLMTAFGRAALGKRGRPDVEAYRANLDGELSALRSGILDGTYPLGNMRRFRIRDPKPRLIHAPCFRERVLHHALMAGMGPVLDGTLIFDTYACRAGKGVHAAVRRAQQFSRRSRWYAQIDIRHYFPNIDHAVLTDQLRRKFSDHGLLSLVARILQTGADRPGKGLPIGALTSQNFANAYLGPFDRRMSERRPGHGYLRYMDDMIWWDDDKASLRASLDAAARYLSDRLGLEVKSPVRVGRSVDGISFCGYRITPHRILLSRRRKQRYSGARRVLERAFSAGHMSEADLQRRMDAILAVTAQADATVWRRQNLLRHPFAGQAAGA
ncbi:MAG: RNA-dependent DNA polymerase [Pelagibaca sp.]|nr:RNA-dependent DNA polymerase [Pelagibaca sp.]